MNKWNSEMFYLLDFKTEIYTESTIIRNSSENHKANVKLYLVIW